MKDRLQSGHDLHFVIQEEHRGEHARKVPITSDVIDRMIRNCQFKMSKIVVELSNELATTEISLRLGPEGAFLISRFPRSLLQDDTSGKSQ